MDGAFQTVLSLLVNTEKRNGVVYLPYALGSIEILKPLSEVCSVYVSQVEEKFHSNIKKYDIKIVDDSGYIIVRIKNFSFYLYII